jgi:hypothetical protein
MLDSKAKMVFDDKTIGFLISMTGAERIEQNHGLSIPGTQPDSQQSFQNQTHRIRESTIIQAIYPSPSPNPLSPKAVRM